MAGTWIEVDLDAVAENYRQVLYRLDPETACMAVVKADAYGLGAAETARVLEQAGCKAFAVTRVEEGLILREHGLEGLILVLEPSGREEWPRALAAGLQLTLSDLASITPLNAVCGEMAGECSPLRVHLKVETGMGRTGFLFSELEELAAALKKASHLQVVGIYTHFARAAQQDRAYTVKQYERFTAFTDRLEKLGVRPDWKHVCNSAAFLDYPEWHHDFVRVGTLLTGHYPGAGFGGKINLQDPWTAKSRIIQVRQVPAKTYVGYRSLYRTKTKTQLAVISAGYTDGFGVAPHFTPDGWWDFLKILIKNLAALFGVYLGREQVKLKDRSVRVAGKIGMQLTVLDIGSLKCEPGDEVVIPLRRTAANPRLPRIYKQDGKLLARREIKEEYLPVCRSI